MFDIQEHPILVMISFETYMVSRNLRPVHPFKDLSTASFFNCYKDIFTVNLRIRIQGCGYSRSNAKHGVCSPAVPHSGMSKARRVLCMYT